MDTPVASPDQPKLNQPIFLAAIGKIVSAVGLLVLAGWFFDIEVLKRLSPNFVAMNPVTAICFVFLGIAFECLRRSEQTVWRRIGMGLAAVVTIVGALKLGSYVIGVPFRLDALLFGLRLEEAALRIPNQMAPNTALNFLLTGVAFLLLRAGPRNLPVSHLLALLVSATSLLAVVGYLYGVTQFTRLSNVFIPMALHTAVTFIFLCAGILFFRNDTTMAEIFASNGAARLVALRLFPLIIVVIPLLGWLRLYGERRGFFPGAVGTALLVVAMIFGFAGVLWWTLSSLHRVEEARRMAEQELARSREETLASLNNLQLVMNHASELICSLDSAGSVVDVNEAAFPLLGLTPRQLVGGKLRDHVHPDDRPQWDALCANTQRGIAGCSTRLRFRRKDDRVINIAWSLQASAHHQRIFCVGRSEGATPSLRAWDEVS